MSTLAEEYQNGTASGSGRAVAAYGIGGPLIGRVNDSLGATADPQVMRYSLLLCPAASAFAALLLWLGSRKLGREV